jgi:Gluconate 2-dehydrogenase subunit 3
MKRREVFPILGAAAALELDGAAPAGYQPRALSQPEYDLMTAIANLILPADEVSKGAGDAGAAFYIDTLLFHGNEAGRTAFKTGLAPLLSATNLDAALAKLAEDERKPGSFFLRLKLLTIDAYCLSPEGRQYLRYSGDTAIEQFKGCDHPEHR